MLAPRSPVRLLFILAFVLAMGGSGVKAEPQDSGDAPRPRTSVRGTLVNVNHVSNTLIMKSDGGENLSWRFGSDVIAELEQFEGGARVIVIYRDLPGGIKRVTAVAFPGTETSPTYVNMTGDRVVLRSAPARDGGCDAHADGRADATESIIPDRGLAEVLDACWCCAVAGETCNTTTKSGIGRAYLVQCFE